MKQLKWLIGFLLAVTFFVVVWPKSAMAASLSLSPASAVKKVGDIFSVDIVLDTGQDSVSGATAILKYDTTRLQVQDDDSGTAGIQIRQGTIFNQTPLTNTVDTTAGQIRFDSGSLGTSYSGSGVMATVHLKALAVGTAAVTFVFDSNSTIDTSLVVASSGPTNILDTVQDGNYTISTGSAVVTPTQTLMPTGVVENTMMVLVGGLLFLVAGWYFAKK